MKMAKSWRSWLANQWPMWLAKIGVILANVSAAAAKSSSRSVCGHVSLS
jgi:hypothetical protein